jgi:mitogen-activated protein kinase 7
MHGDYNPNRNSSSIAAGAVPTQHDDIRQMDVDALERELGGGI